MRIAVVPLLFVLSIPVASADFGFQGLKVLCANGTLEISSYNLENEHPSANQVPTSDGGIIFFDTSEHMTQCKVAGHNIKVRHSNNEHDIRGACSQAPGSWVALWLDGTTIFQGGVFNNDCQESFDKVKFMENKKHGFTVEFCGHDNPPSTFAGCLNYRQNQFMSFKFPLPPFPLSWLRDNKPLEPTR